MSSHPVVVVPAPDAVAVELVESAAAVADGVVTLAASEASSPPWPWLPLLLPLSSLPLFSSWGVVALVPVVAPATWGGDGVVTLLASAASSSSCGVAALAPVLAPAAWTGGGPVTLAALRPSSSSSSSSPLPLLPPPLPPLSLTLPLLLLPLPLPLLPLSLDFRSRVLSVEAVRKPFTIETGGACCPSEVYSTTSLGLWMSGPSILQKDWKENPSDCRATNMKPKLGSSPRTMF